MGGAGPRGWEGCVEGEGVVPGRAEAACVLDAHTFRQNLVCISVYKILI